MKNLKKIMFLAIAVFALALSSSCSSDDSPKEEEVPTSTADFIKFKYKGTEYNFEPAISVSGAVNIYGSAGINDTYKKVSLWMPTSFTVGSHPVVYDLSQLETAYQADFDFSPAISNGHATSGMINIISVTGGKIQGTFTLSGGTSGQETFAVTDGSFRITTD